MRFAYVHAHPHRDPCFDNAFFLIARPVPGTPIASANVVLHDGTQPPFGSSIRCGACGRPMLLDSPDSLLFAGLLGGLFTKNVIEVP